jgi:hypothetical protein
VPPIEALVAAPLVPPAPMLPVIVVMSSVMAIVCAVQPPPVAFPFDHVNSGADGGAHNRRYRCPCDDP